MAKAVARSGLTTGLVIFEIAVIIAGLVGVVAIAIAHRRDERRARHELAVAAPGAPSACAGAHGTQATLRAWLDGAELFVEPAGPEPAIDAAMQARGSELFAAHCATCHGPRGDGTGPTAGQLAHRPANFTLGTYELRTTEHEALPTDRDMFRTISRGVHGTAMPPWDALPERDRWALAVHLKTLSTQFAEDEAPPPIEVATPPAETPARLAHGAQIYSTGGCASCHGATGHGDGPAASSLTYRGGGPALPRDLTLGRFHRSTRLGDIHLTIVAGLDGTPMASFAKVLTPDDLWDVAMFVHSLTPALSDRSEGLRCPKAPIALNPDEVIGVRTLMHSLQPTD